MAGRMAAQRRGLQMRQKQRDLLDFCFSHTVYTVQKWKEIVHILSFPINKSFLAGGGRLSITQVNKWTLATGRGHPSVGGVLHTSQSSQSPICPLNSIGSFFCFPWFFALYDHKWTPAREEDIPFSPKPQYCNATIQCHSIAMPQYYISMLVMQGNSGGGYSG